MFLLDYCRRQLSVSFLSEEHAKVIILAMVGIGVYMACLESVYLKNVDHLDKEALFSKVVGIAYIVLAIIGLFFKLWR